jgi:hypothetical protein
MHYQCPNADGPYRVDEPVEHLAFAAPAGRPPSRARAGESVAICHPLVPWWPAGGRQDGRLRCPGEPVGASVPMLRA